MESDRPDPLPGFLASSPGSAATFDRPEGRLDQSEDVAPSRPLSMTLRSHSRAGRSKTPNPENVGSTVRTESEHPQPETEDASCAGRVMRKIPDSPDIDSSGETGKTPSGPILQDRPGPEMEITACPPVHPSSSTQTLHQTTFSTGHNRGITTISQVFNGSNRKITPRYQVFMMIEHATRSTVNRPAVNALDVLQ